MSVTLYATRFEQGTIDLYGFFVADVSVRERLENSSV